MCVSVCVRTLSREVVVVVVVAVVAVVVVMVIVVVRVYLHTGISDRA